MRARRAAARKSKRTPSEQKRRRKKNPKRQPGERYSRRSYRAAVLRACKLLSEGTPDRKGWGDLVVADIGGATTDIHSAAAGSPTKPGAILRGLPELWYATSEACARHWLKTFPAATHLKLEPSIWRDYPGSLS